MLMCCWQQVMSAKDSVKNSPTKKQALRPRAAADIADQVTAITVQDPCSMASEPCETFVEARHRYATKQHGSIADWHNSPEAC